MGTPHPNRAAVGSGMWSGILMQVHCDMTLYSAKAPIKEERATSRPW